MKTAILIFFILLFLGCKELNDLEQCKDDKITHELEQFELEKRNIILEAENKLLLKTINILKDECLKKIVCDNIIIP